MTADQILSEARAADDAENAVIDMAAMLRATARRLGQSNTSPEGRLTEIYSDRINRQARALGRAAVRHLCPVNYCKPERNILGCLTVVDMASAFDHEAEAEAWEQIRDIADEEARECRDRLDDND